MRNYLISDAAVATRGCWVWSDLILALPLASDTIDSGSSLGYRTVIDARSCAVASSVASCKS